MANWIDVGLIRYGLVMVLLPVLLLALLSVSIIPLMMGWLIGMTEMWPTYLTVPFYLVALLGGGGLVAFGIITTLDWAEHRLLVLKEDMTQMEEVL